MTTDARAVLGADEFLLARARAMAHSGQEKVNPKIGVYREKLLHSTLKYFYQPNDALHEQACAGMVADALLDGRAIEIQTGGFAPLKRKIERYFEADQPVRVVCPLPHQKFLIWLDPETGEATPPRKSPHTGTFFDALWELSYLLPYLDGGNLTIELLLIDMQEYRLQDGRRRGGKRGSHRMERYPLSLADRLLLTCTADCTPFVTSDLPNPFTAAAYGKVAHLSERQTARALWCLSRAGLIFRDGKDGRKILYRRDARYFFSDAT